MSIASEFAKLPAHERLDMVETAKTVIAASAEIFEGAAELGTGDVEYNRQCAQFMGVCRMLLDENTQSLCHPEDDA